MPGRPVIRAQIRRKLVPLQHELANHKIRCLAEIEAGTFDRNERHLSEIETGIARRFAELGEIPSYPQGFLDALPHVRSDAHAE